MIRDFNLKKRKYCKSFILTAFLSYFLVTAFVLSNYLSCSKPVIIKDAGLRFALISNTYSDSPYQDPGHGVTSTIDHINEDNPLFVVHLGGLVCGGTKWQGVSTSNIKRQYKEIFSDLSLLSPILYTVKCETELFKGKPEYYLKYARREPYYSFNYGDIHFLVLDSSSGTGTGISEEQLYWIKKDLGQHEHSEAIMVFMCNPMFLPAKYKLSDSMTRCADYEILHKIFIEFKVKAVFSGNNSKYFRMDIDGISYINAGCSGFNRVHVSRYSYQYYIVDYKEGYLSVIPRNIKY